MEREREDEFFDYYIEPATPPPCLFGRIVSRIRTEKKIAASRKKAAYFTFAFAGSIAAFIGAAFALEGALIESELLKLLSVIFSDPGTAIANWQDFSFFFLELLPVAYIVLFLTSLFALLESLKYVVKYFSGTLSLSKLIKTN